MADWLGANLKKSGEISTVYIHSKTEKEREYQWMKYQWISGRQRAARELLTSEAGWRELHSLECLSRKIQLRRFSLGPQKPGAVEKAQWCVGIRAQRKNKSFILKYILRKVEPWIPSH